MTWSRATVGLIVAVFTATIVLYSQFESDASEGQRVVIEIRSFEFVPARPAVKAGDVVVWKNKDIVPHTATAKDESWDSGEIASGGEWQMIVTADMLADYYCIFHPTMVASLDIGS